MKNALLWIVFLLLFCPAQAQLVEPSEAERNRIEELCDNGQFEEALKEALRLHQSYPKDKRILSSLASANFSIGRLEEAEKWGELLLEGGSKDLDDYGLCGAIKLARGKAEEALPYFKLALEIAQVQGVDSGRYANNYLGCLFAAGKADEALGFGLAHLEEHPKAPLYQFMAGIYVDRKDYASAIKIAERGLKQTPDSPDLLFAAGGAHYKLGHQDKAEKIYSKLEKLGGEYVPRLRAILDGKKDPGAD